VAGDHFATVESISKRAVAIHNAGGFGTAAKNQSLAGRITGKSSVWSRMARMFFQPIDAPRFGLLPEPDDNRGFDPCRIPGKHKPVTNLANFLEARFWIPSLFPTLS